MREIIQVQLGQCGNNIGKEFWKILLEEHRLIQGRRRGCGPDLQYVNVFFAEGADRTYWPRAVLVDLDPGNLKSVFGGNLFKPDNVVVGKSGAGNNWAKGYYNEGAELANLTLELVRTEAEACDLMQGIQIVHSLAGGTGSGVGSLLARKMKDEYPDRILKSYATMPLSGPSEVVVEPYNAVLSMPSLINYIDQVVCMDNRALYQFRNPVESSRRRYDDINYLIAMCMSNITACMRSPGQLNTNLHKLQVNLVPFPRLHFFVPSYAELEKTRPEGDSTVRRLMQQMFDTRNMFVKCNLEHGQLLTVAAIFRGRISPTHVEDEMWNIQNTRRSNFVDWIHCNIQKTVCEHVWCNMKICATSLFNTTAIQEPLQQLLKNFDKLLKDKSYLHWYIREGMEESDFLEARDELSAVISEYVEQQDNSFKMKLEEEPQQELEKTRRKKQKQR